MTRMNLSFLKQFEDETLALLGTVIAKPVSAYLGDPVTREVFANIEETLVYVHGIGGADDGTTIMPRGGIPKEKTTLYQPILIKRTDSGDFRYVGIDEQADLIYNAGGTEEPDITPVYHNQIRWGTIQLFSGLQVLVTGATYGEYYVKDQLSGIFDGTATDTSATAINAPSTNNRSIGVLIQLDPVTSTLSYKQSTTFNSSISLQTAYTNNLLPTLDNNRVRVGYLKLSAGATAFTANDIWNYFSVFDDGSPKGLLGYPNPVTEDTTLEAGRELIVADQLVIDSGATFSVGAGAQVIVVRTGAKNYKTVRTITASTTLLPSDERVYVDAGAGAVTVTLPSAIINAGLELNIKAIDTTNTVTVTSSQNIEGSADDITLTLNESITLNSDSSDWWVI